MPYRCPLCLKEVGGEQKLIRFCLQHDQAANFSAEEFDCLQDRNKIYCKDKTSTCNYRLERGVFLLHVGCTITNPFWEKTIVKVPGDGNTKFENSASFPYQDAEYTHWQILVIRRLPRNRREMWFPLNLLRATAETSENGNKRIGRLVELAGTRQSGKTVLTMQAMDQKGYVHKGQPNRNVNLKHYIFSARAENAEENPLLELFQLRDVMERNDAYVPPDGNAPGEDSLKAIFIEPKKRALESTPPRNELIAGAKKGVFSFWQKLWKDFIDTFKGIFGYTGTGKSITTENTFWYCAVFYDTSGEEQKRGSLTVEELEDSVEKVAVIIKAPEIFDWTTMTDMESSIVVANRKLTQLQDREHLQICLVVTHVDELLDDKFKNKGDFNSDIEAARKFSEDMNANPENGGKAKEMLVRWLSYKADKDEPHPNLTTLRNLSENIEVYFVWTEGIPKPNQTTKHARTYSFGLARFMCWCLEIGWGEINQASVKSA